LQNKICIVDTDKEIALFSLYLNRETGKTNGFYVKDSDSNKLSNILKHYAFDVPISVILLKRAEQSMLFQHDTYTRRLEVGKKRDAVELVTYVAAGSEYFKHRPFHVGEKQPFERGLLDNPKAKLRLQNKKMDFAKTHTSNVNISLVRTDNLPIQFAGISIRSTNREIRESANMESFKVSSEKQLLELAEKNEQIAEEVAKKNEEITKRLLQKSRLENNRFIIQKGFKTSKGNTERFIDKPDGTHFSVFAVKLVEAKFGKSFLLLVSEGRDTTAQALDKAKLTTIWATKNVADFIEPELLMLKYLGHGIFGSISGKPVMELDKVGVYYNQAKHKCAKVQISSMRQVDKESEIPEQKDNFLIANERYDIQNRMEQGHIRMDCSHAIDSVVKEGDTIEVRKYCDNKKSVLYTIGINGENKDVIGNAWLNELMRPSFSNRTKILPFMVLLVGPKKRHPIAKKSCFTFANSVLE
jgi:hypothetical protein